MDGQVVHFHSDGYLLEADLYDPSSTVTPAPAVVFAPGSRVTRRTPYYTDYVTRIVEAGFVVLLMDYRGWGGSEGPTGTLYPMEQVADLRSAVTYLEGRPEVDVRGISVFGVSMGGAHAMTAAALDERIGAVAAVLSPMDGAAMLRGSRREHEWREFESLMREDRARRVTSGEGGTIDGFAPATPERRATSALAADPIPPLPIACAEAIAEYRPLDLVGRISPRAALWISATADPVCPPEDARLAYARAGSPKRLVEIESSEHYGTYTGHRDLILDEAIAWFRRHGRRPTVRAIEEP